MSEKVNRVRLSKAHNNHEYLVILCMENYGPYWDEGLNFYPEYRRGYKNSNKRILSYQVRRYKTWKHNRKYQWKSKKK